MPLVGRRTSRKRGSQCNVRFIGAHRTGRALRWSGFENIAMYRSNRLPYSVSRPAGKSMHHRWRKLVELACSIAAITLWGCAESPPTPVEKPIHVAQSLVDGTKLAIDQVGDTKVLGFGRAIAVDGDTCLIGARGRAYVFVRAGAIWRQKAVLAPGPGDADESFGIAVALEGSVAVVGAPSSNSNQGALFIYEGSGETWALQGSKWTEPGTSQLGAAVAVSGKTVLAGAPKADLSGPIVEAGAVHVFEKTASTWQESAPALQDPSANANEAFGASLVFRGDTALVGAPGDGKAGLDGAGAAYLFTKSGTVWSTLRITSSDLQAHDAFGASVALSDNAALVGAPFAVTAAGATGAAYHFQRSGAELTSERKLVDANGMDGDSFGNAVALGGTSSLVDSPLGNYYAGAVFLYDDSKPTSEPEALKGPEGVEVDSIGSGVALSGQLAFVGALTSTNEGLVFTFAGENGVSCGNGAGCTTGNCVDGVCCDLACASPCTSCRNAFTQLPDGHCGPTVPGSDPHSECAQDLSSNECGKIGGCNGAGACSLALAGKVCGDKNAACVSSSEFDPADTCDGLGKCDLRPPLECAKGYLCASNVCPTTCTADDQCDTDSGFVCSSGSCKIPQGKPCHADDECSTGHCPSADGVCCNAQCDGDCEACTKKNKGSGADGVCEDVDPGSDNKDKCPQGKDPCDADGQCDGKGRCRSFALDTQPCGETTCTGSTETGKLCDGQGTCGDDTEDCVGYRCDGTACGTTCANDADCATGRFCDGLNRCEIKKADGAGCGNSKECQGACVNASSNALCAGENDCACASLPLCDADARVALQVDGPQPCGLYNCRSGACLTACENTSDDCAPGENLACNQENHECERLTATPSSSGCRFALSSDEQTGSWSIAALACMTALIRRKRRNDLTLSMQN